jgi:GcrA cell cycle regulator
MTHANNDFDWNDETVGRLKALWAEGQTTAEIGRRMGISKNAIVGKAHRLKLDARPSPIRRGNAQPHAPAARPHPSCLAEMMPVPRSTPAPAPARVQKPEPQVKEPAAQLRVIEQSTLAIATVRRASPVNSCCWPIGEPGTRAFRFCDANALAGKPYCAAHSQRAYIEKRPTRDERSAERSSRR